MAAGNFTKSRHSFAQASPPIIITAAGTVNGTAIDKEDEISDEGVLVVQTGATSGTPDSFTVTFKIEHSDDNGDTDAYAAVTDLNIVEAATKTVTAENAVGTLAFKTAGLKRYFRAVLTRAFVAGTTPKVYADAIFVFGKRRYD